MLAIYERVYGTREHPSTATTLYNLADLYETQQDFPAALSYFQRALAMETLIYGAEHAEVATTRQRVVALQQRLGIVEEEDSKQPSELLSSNGLFATCRGQSTAG